MLLDYCTLDPIPDVFGAIQKACKKKMIFQYQTQTCSCIPGLLQILCKLSLYLIEVM